MLNWAVLLETQKVQAEARELWVVAAMAPEGSTSLIGCRDGFMGWLMGDDARE